MRSLFESTGLRVCGEAVDGVDAIQKAEELQPDLVVLDLSMPNMNGIEAARALKKIRPQLQILLLTAHFSALSSYDILEAGIDAVVAKGGEPSALLDSVRHLLKITSTSSPAAAD